MANLVSCYILVKGRVQGIGFRFHSVRLADSLGLTGYVRNSPTGEVEIEVEGDKQTIQTFVGNIQKGPMRLYITGLEIRWEEYQNKYDSFDIKF